MFGPIGIIGPLWLDARNIQAARPGIVVAHAVHRPNVQPGNMLILMRTCCSVSGKTLFEPASSTVWIVSPEGSASCSMCCLTALSQATPFIRDKLKKAMPDTIDICNYPIGETS